MMIAAAAIGCGDATGDGASTSDGATSSTGADTRAPGSSTGAATSSTTEEVDGSSGTTSGPVDPSSVAPLTVMTFNVLCEICDPTFDPWEQRLTYIGDTIARYDPDLIGLQELATAENVQQILDLAPGYEAIAFLDQGAAGDFPDATILVRSERFDIVDHGFYWLSPTPDVPLSTGFSGGIQLPRQVTWVQLDDDDGQSLRFIDTHFDNNAPSQELSAPLVIERTRDPAALTPTIVVGDFNSNPSTVAYSILTEPTDPDGFAFSDAFVLARSWMQVSNRDPPAYDPASRIDHIFVDPRPWVVHTWSVDTFRYGDAQSFTSDHFAIVAELELPRSR